MAQGRSPSDSYFVVGTDGNRYGPAELATLRSWVLDGRIGPETILIDAVSEQSTTAESVPGLFEFAHPPTSVITPENPPQKLPQMPPKAKSSPPWESEPTQETSIPSNPPMSAAKTLLIAAGILSFGCVFGCGIVGAVLLPVYSQARSVARQDRELSKLKQLGAAVLHYSQNHNNRMPPDLSSAGAAESALSAYANDAAIYQSATPATTEILGNSKLNGQDLTAIVDPSQTVLFYENPWTNDEAFAVFADGHAEQFASLDPITEMLQTDPFKATTGDLNPEKTD